MNMSSTPAPVSATPHSNKRALVSCESSSFPIKRLAVRKSEARRSVANNLLDGNDEDEDIGEEEDVDEEKGMEEEEKKEEKGEEDQEERGGTYKYPQASLGGIPEHILLHIFKQFFDHEALESLCCVDWRCRRTAEEVLYANLDGTSFDCRKLRAIAHRPSLARYVRDFKYISNISFGKDPMGKTFVRVLKNAHNVQTLAISEEYLWCGAYRTATSHGWLDLFNKAVILNQLTQVPCNRFVNLKELTIAVKSITVDDLSCLFLLPSLEDLHLKGVRQTTPFKNWNVPKATCSIKSLVLTRVKMEMETTTQMLACIKNLEKFVYQSSRKRWRLFSKEHPLEFSQAYSWKHLADALEQHKHSLEYLDVSEYIDWKRLDDSPYEEGCFGHLGSFRDFPNLYYIAAPIDAFIDIQPDHTMGEVLDLMADTSIEYAIGLMMQEGKVNRYDVLQRLPAQLECFRMTVGSAHPADVACFFIALASLRTTTWIGPKPLVELDLTRVQQQCTPLLYEALKTIQQDWDVLGLFEGSFQLTMDDTRRENYIKYCETEEEHEEHEEYEEKESGNKEEMYEEQDTDGLAKWYDWSAKHNQEDGECWVIVQDVPKV